MNLIHPTEAQISRALEHHVPRPQAGLRDRVLDAVAMTTQQRALWSFLGRLWDADPVGRRRSLLLAAALFVALAVAGVAAVGSIRELQQPVPNPLVWTPAAIKRDWPVEVRTEPVGEAVVVPWTSRGLGQMTYADLRGDTGTAGLGWIDIRSVELDTCLPSPCGTRFLVYHATDIPLPVVRPTVRWIAYGIVLDLDEDGVADVRIGVDNTPPSLSGDEGHRVWRTDLHTGDTSWSAGPPYGAAGPYELDTWFPGEGLGNLAKFVGEDIMESRSYVWATVIEDGRVIAVDYAPDAGWLDPTP